VLCNANPPELWFWLVVLVVIVGTGLSAGCPPDRNDRLRVTRSAGGFLELMGEPRRGGIRCRRG
jgi:hypothetical protein